MPLVRAVSSSAATKPRAVEAAAGDAVEADQEHADGGRRVGL